MYQNAKYFIAILASAFTASASAQSAAPLPVEKRVKLGAIKPLLGEYFEFNSDKPGEKFYCHKSVVDNPSDEIVGLQCFSGLAAGSVHMKGTSIAPNNPYEFAGMGEYRHKETGQTIRFHVPSPK